MAALVAAGGVTALAGDRLGYESAKNVGIALVFAGAIMFGLDMIIRRRADIGTRYTSSVNPAFHVFRDAAAIAWGVAFLAAGAILVAGAIASLGGGSAEGVFSAHPGLFMTLAGVFVTGWAVGSAGRATRRSGGVEQPARRRLDRLMAMVFLLPLGLLILSWGLFVTFAPDTASLAATRAKAAVTHWIGALLK
jgi:hypothetical protein